MSGKFFVAIVAVAVSSASAATVGVVYTRIVQHKLVGAAVSASEAASGQVKSAIVLNASEEFFEPFAGWSADGDAPVCPADVDSRSCVVVPRASDLHVNILGYTLTIPPVWLGGDSEDQYANNTGRFASPEDGSPLTFEFVAPGDRRHARSRSNLQSSPQSNEDQSQALSSDSPSDATDSPTSSLSIFVDGFGSVEPPEGFNSIGEELTLEATFRDFLDGGRAPPPGSIADGSVAGALWNADGGIRPGPSSYFDRKGDRAAVPEPSTWMMMAVGTATLGFFKRRQIVAALKSALG